MRLIDADALADVLFEKHRNYPQWVAETIGSMPEVGEPKNGYWIYKRHDDMFMCSSCEKYSIRNDYPYCHWCGAKMKQEGGE